MIEICFIEMGTITELLYFRSFLLLTTLLLLVDLRVEFVSDLEKFISSLLETRVFLLYENCLLCCHLSVAQVVGCVC